VANPSLRTLDRSMEEGRERETARRGAPAPGPLDVIPVAAALTHEEAV
jgi:hypothetical protein